MTSPQRADPAEGSAFRADMSAVEIDIRCALVLARIAIQTLADATPENHTRIQKALDEAIDGARLEASNGSDAVVGLLSDFKQRLADAADQSKIWYLE